jgi:hypothetical protein
LTWCNLWVALPPGSGSPRKTRERAQIVGWALDAVVLLLGLATGGSIVVALLAFSYLEYRALRDG